MPERSLPTLYPDRCTACGLCLSACPEGVLALEAGRPVFARPLACTYCGACEMVCPAEAVELYYEIVRAPEQEAQGRRATEGDTA
jgi:NAD-dependent dihydropyrimidine dehydrogenase PreA subunit